MKDITGYYKDPSTGTYRFVAKGEPIRVPTKPAATAALTQFLASQTAAHEAQQRAERVRTFDLKSMTATEKADVGIQMFHAFTGMRGRLRDTILAQQPEPPPATPATKTRTEAFTTMLWGEEASERIAEREERKASGRKRAREDIFGAALSIKPGLEHVFSPTTKEISVLTAPWYATQQKKVGLGGEAEAREAQKLSEEYQRAITGEDRRSISEIRDIEQRLSTSYAKYESARGPPPLSLTEAEKTRTWAHKSHQVAEGIRGLTLPEVTGVTPVAKLVQEGAAGITEYFGGAPTTLKYGVPLVAKEPALIVPLAAVAGVGFGKAAYHEPAQTATTLAMTYGLSKVVGKAGTKAGEVMKFRGKTFVPSETIVEARLLTDAHGTFPTISPSIPPAARSAAMLQTFKTSQFKLPHEKPGEAGWHATTAKFTKEAEAAVGARPETAPGLHIAPSASIHFLRLQKPQIKFFDMPSFTRSHPGLLRIGVEAFERMPRHVREAGIAEQVRFIYGQKGVPKAYISPAVEALGKTELEAIIAPGTRISQKGFRYYTKIEGKKVPIYEYKAVAGDIGDIVAKRGTTASELSKTYGSAMGDYYTKPIVTPLSSAYLLPLYKPSSSVWGYTPPSSAYKYTPPSVRKYTPTSISKLYSLPSVRKYTPPPSVRKYTPTTISKLYSLPSVRKYTPPPSVRKYTPPPSVPKYVPIFTGFTPPPPTWILPKPKDKPKKRKRKTSKKRGMFAWEVKNPIRAFFGTPAEDAKEIQSILGITPVRKPKK
jgi:hypothetical protein